jgi:hypothetical protein
MCATELKTLCPAHTSACRLARECSENGVLNPELATGIVNVQSMKLLGRRIGNGLTVSEAQKLIGKHSLLAVKPSVCSEYCHPKNSIEEKFVCDLSRTDGAT